jgi:putative ABC transport system permease protein
MHNLSIDAYVLGFIVLVSLLSCVLFSLAPTLRLLSHEILPALQRSAGRSTSSRYRLLQDGLVVTQIALALVLLVGAGLLGRSFVSLMCTDLGLKPENVLTFSLGLPAMQYQENHKRSAFLARLESELRSLPGVRAAGSTSLLPFTTWNSCGFSVKDGVPTQADVERMARYQAVSLDYFISIGTRLVKGRFFNEHDTQGTVGKIVINETMARRFWPDQNPIGTRLDLAIRYGKNTPSSYEIVGIVADAKQQNVQAEIQPEMSWLNAQHPAWEVVFTVRSSAAPLSLLEPIRSLIADLDKTVTISDVHTLQERISDTFTRERFSLFLYGFFAIVALLLASLGIYGVMAYAVNLRRQEIGIRIALGARPGQILHLILGKGMRLTFLGLIIGLVGSLALTSLMASMLYQIKTTDPLTFTLVPVMILAVVLLASVIPARRAVKIDPMEALRYE